MDFSQARREYVTGPSTERLRRLWIAIQQSPTFSPRLPLPSNIWRCTSNGDHEGLLEGVERFMPGAFFSPRVHLACSTALRALGREREAATQLKLARMALGSLRVHGSGTREAPWLVLRVSDAYDAINLDGLDVEFSSQVGGPGRLVDEFLLTNGKRVCFEIFRPEARPV